MFSIGSKVAILGMGISGKAVSQFLKKKGISHFGVDKEPFFFEGITVLSEKDKACLQDVTLVVKSPGIPHTHPWVKEADSLGILVVGEIDLALSEIKNKQVFAVTGSNGKTTTTLFLSHLLYTCGKKSLAVGNVGIPLISQLDSDHEIFVVELSSFQLEKIHPFPIFDAAIILNITPNHLDRHASFEEYANAKLNIKTCLKKGGKLLVSEDVAKNFAPGAMTFDFYQEKVETILSLGYREGKKFYTHDLQNFSAAYAAVLPNDDDFRKAVLTFQKPPHRIEFVREINGISFINDSKSTSVDATLKAVSCMDSNVILLAGGVDKGGSYKMWIPAFRKKVSKVFAFGKAADRMLHELSCEIPISRVASLEEGISHAISTAGFGDVILLSPGCASYDQFRDYEQRGERFKEIIKSL